MAETWRLILLDDRVSPPAPVGLERLLGFSLWDRATREVQTLAVLRLDGDVAEELDDALASAGWPQPLWRASLAMAPTPPWVAEEVDGTHRRVVHLARFAAEGSPDAARARRNAYVARRQDRSGLGFWTDVSHWHRGEDLGSGDAWAIPVSVPRVRYTPHEIGHHGDELCGLIAELDMPDDAGGDFLAYLRRL